MKHLFCVAALLFLFAACGDENKKQIEVLKKDTMTVHDEAMKDLAEMNRTKRQLKDFMTVATMTPEQSAQFTGALAAIEKADEDMMTWMQEYADPDEMPAADAIKYLQEQKTKIEKNRDDIRAALEAGKKLLPSTSEQ